MTCPSDYPFIFSAGCNTDSGINRAGKGCYKLQSQADACSGASDSWCVFDAYKNDDTDAGVREGSLKEQLAKGDGSVCSNPPSSGGTGLQTCIANACTATQVANSDKAATDSITGMFKLFYFTFLFNLIPFYLHICYFLSLQVRLLKQ